jgi:sensor histidine kinase regulating citrate/malate metabolism
MQVCVDSYAKTKVEDYDLCSIITNILDNAIEAAKRVKEIGKEVSPIEVHIGHRAGYLVLKVRNPIVEPLRKNKKGQYVSSKKENGSLKGMAVGLPL